MKTTSHFIGIELQTEIFSDFFVSIYKYLKDNKIENIIEFQNPLSPHITLYYLEKDISNDIKKDIKDSISKLDIDDSIFLDTYNYFSRNGNKYVLYISSITEIPLDQYRNHLHSIYKQESVIDNTYSFSPHITLLKILDASIFEQHRENIETIIETELNTIKTINVSSKKIHLYAVNSNFKEQIQIKL